MEWLVFSAITILIVLYARWAKVQLEKLNTPVIEVDDMGRRVKSPIEGD